MTFGSCGNRATTARPQNSLTEPNKPQQFFLMSPCPVLHQITPIAVGRSIERPLQRTQYSSDPTSQTLQAGKLPLSHIHQVDNKLRRRIMENFRVENRRGTSSNAI